MARDSDQKTKRCPSRLLILVSAPHYYLIAYNVVSALGWILVLDATLAHLIGLTAPPPASKFARFFATSRIPDPPRWLPVFTHGLFKRACTAFTLSRVGPIVRVVQTGALLEVVHVLVGLVRSPLGTTAMQVASRIYLVWGITESFASTRLNPFYASMVLAWSVTEVIRYTFYAFNLSERESSLLVYLRYTTFYVLYPLGASSEAALIFSTLPNSSPFSGKWTLYDFVRGALFTIWWPGLYVMYMHMVKQRRKVLGAGKFQPSARSRLEILKGQKTD